MNTGLKDYGYDLLMLYDLNAFFCTSKQGLIRVRRDCGWPSMNRTSSGELTWNTSLLPSGIPALASYVHDLGLKFGVYSDAYVSFLVLPITN